MILDEEIAKVKRSLVNMSSCLLPEILIPGISNQLCIEPDMVVERTLPALNAPQLVNDVLDVRQVHAKKKIHTETGSVQLKSSYIIKFKSGHIARHIITPKRREGLLTLSQVFDCSLSGNIYINGFLNPSMHSL